MIAAAKAIRCFRCKQAMPNIAEHMQKCPIFNEADRAKFQEARKKFRTDPARAMEIARGVLNASGGG